MVAGGASSVNGAFVATYLDYDKGSNEGISLSDASATFSAEDSTFHGSGGGDYLVASGAKSFHLAYSIVSGSHCPFHFNSVTHYDVDHSTIQSNAYGSMLYNADVGPHSFSNSNFETNAAHDLELTQMGVELTLDNVYLGSNNSVFKSAPTVKNGKPGAAIADAKPRAQSAGSQKRRRRKR